MALLHFRLDQRMPGFPHQRLAAALGNPGGEPARAFDVVDDLGAGVAAQHVVRKQHQLPVGVDDVAALGDHAEPVAVAVEREAQLRAGIAHRGDQLLQVLRLGRIGMMVGKGAVDFAIQRRHFAAEAAEQLGRSCAGDTVAAVDGDVHRPREPDIAGDARQVRCAHIGRRVLARALGQVAALDARAQALDVRARQRHPGQHHFQPVIIGRIVAARDHHHAAAAEVVRGEIAHRRGRHADVDDVDAGRGETLGQRGAKLGTGQPAVAAYGHRGLRARARFRAQRPAYRGYDLRRECAPDDAADVVGLENLCGNGNHVRCTLAG